MIRAVRVAGVDAIRVAVVRGKPVGIGQERSLWRGQCIAAAALALLLRGRTSLRLELVCKVAILVRNTTAHTRRAAAAAITGASNYSTSRLVAAADMRGEAMLLLRWRIRHRIVVNVLLVAHIAAPRRVIVVATRGATGARLGSVHLTNEERGEQREKWETQNQSRF